ncbi:MAG: hypothetical protein GC203_10610 [Phenylobacterium sp.]|uniref:hypothetical protein n=1 Tax=Phenylobacterium sp. TaxID=1871053 RepID=UPI0025F02D75|nr:hypothetical protein [Phenylobacterium sp.]MBI1198302.1 hypothetical protein [Phenylobacterium sp.]
MRRPVEPVRASIDGHAFHHTWAARTALELVDPASDLVALAIEGFSTEDEGLELSQESTEIADLTAYRGGRGSLSATQVHVKQFKYSAARAETPVRAADVAKTVGKFAEAFRDLVGALGRDPALAKMRFSYVTNRPISDVLAAALVELQAGVSPATGSQADALRLATGLKGDDLVAFAARLSFEGSSGSVRGVEAVLEGRLAAWGPAHDSVARLRLLELQRLVRDKAGVAGQNANLIVAVDVLGALGIGSEDDLFPTPALFPDVVAPIVRQATRDLLALSVSSTAPVLAHAVGGMGKTVLLQSVAAAVGADTHTLIFDGFAAGGWRDPSAPRHRPDRGLVHLANKLAADGLCDPLLPGMSDSASLLTAFRRRLVQALETLKQRGREGGILLLLDAIDHSGERARDTQTDSFPKLLVESLSIQPEPGVRVIASCRSHRRDAAVGTAQVELFEVPPFTRGEADALVAARMPDATGVEKTIAYVRSGGNPRLLSTLLAQGRPFEPAPGDEQEGSDEALDRLLAKQVAEARNNAMARGATAADLNALLAGIAFLPPPVPVEELAAAQGLTEDAVKSFAADLFPLIEPTAQGLMFRDEPTETFVRRAAALDAVAQAKVLARLDARQTVSNYAARVLPGVLRDLGRTEALYALASDDRLPATATSGVAQRAIRLARLEAALHVAAVAGDADHSLRFSLDLARLAAGHGRSDGYLRRNPDLVAIADDPEALRRMYEDRGSWGGSRHAALAVIEMLRGNSAEAMRQASRSFEWNNWRARLPQDNDYDFPPFLPFDISGPAWVAVRHGRLGRIGRWFLKWSPGFAFAASCDVVGFLETHARLSARALVARDRLYRVLVRLDDPPPVFVLAVLSQGRIEAPELRIALLEKLAAAEAVFEKSRDYRQQDSQGALIAAVTRAAATAAAAGRVDLVEPILARAPVGRASSHDFEPPTLNPGILVNWLLSALVAAAAKGRDVRLADIAPHEFDVLVRLKRDRKSDEDYAAAVSSGLEKLKARAARAARAAQRKRKRSDEWERSGRSDDRSSDLLSKVLPAWVALMDGIPALVAGGQVELAIRTLYDRADAFVAKTENYPHAHAKRSASDHAGGLADALLASAPTLAEDTGRRAIAFAANTPYQPVASRVDLVAILGRHPATGPLAAEFAQAVSVALQDETSTDTRISRTASLARAVGRVSPVEAKAGFAAGLALADSFSADDMEETLGLIEVAQRYRGPPIDPRTVHGFSRICETQMTGDSDRYDWPGYAEAFARLGGLQVLPLLTRLQARGQGGIEEAHLEALSKLVGAGHLDADLAAGLIGLFEYADLYRFRLPVAYKHLLPSLAPAHVLPLFAFGEVEVDRVYGAGPPRDLVRDLVVLAREHLPPDAPSRRRLEDMTVATTADREEEEIASSRVSFIDQARDPAIVALLGDAKHFSGDDLDAVVQRLPGRGNGRPLVQLLLAAADRQALPDDRMVFLDAVVEARMIPLTDKLFALQDLVKAWAETSVAVRDALPRVVVELARRHAPDLIRGRWDGGFERRRLRELAKGVVPDATLVNEILQRLGGLIAMVPASVWLDFAEVLASSAQPATIADCLARYVAKSEAGLPDAVAGGPWRPSDTPPRTQSAATAGLLWFLLGAPEASTRWRAAHALRRLVSLGRLDVLEELIALIDSTDGGVFQDPDTPFFFLNAKLWLVIAIARIAVDAPSVIIPFQSQLERIAHSEELPHVLIREMAGRALRCVADVLSEAEAAALRSRCDAVNASPFPKPEVQRRGGTGNFYAGRPEGYPERRPPFSFEYDFEKYQVTGLASLFGTHKYEAGDRIADWVHTWVPHAESMWDDYKGDPWGGSRRDSKEGYIGNLTWHGVFLAAGSLLRTHPISGRSWTSDAPWAEWLADGLLARGDGRWMADDTDLTPLDMRAPLTTDDLPVPRLARELAPYFTLGAQADSIVVEGSWDTTDGADMTISSAFVPRARAATAALTTALAYHHDVWVPRADELDRHWDKGSPWRGWLQLDETRRESGLDTHDPYASKAARYNARPTDKIVRAANLKPDPPFARRWRTREGRVLAEGIAWGMRRGKGDHEKVFEGRRLTADLAWIQDLCRQRNQTLILVVQARRYLPKRSGDSAFPSRWLVATVDRDGVLRPLVRIPTAVRQAVSALGLDRRREFQDRYGAVKAALAKPG